MQPRDLLKKVRDGILEFPAAPITVADTDGAIEALFKGVKPRAGKAGLFDPKDIQDYCADLKTVEFKAGQIDLLDGVLQRNPNRPLFNNDGTWQAWVRPYVGDDAKQKEKTSQLVRKIFRASHDLVHDADGVVLPWVKELCEESKVPWGELVKKHDLVPKDKTPSWLKGIGGMAKARDTLVIHVLQTIIVALEGQENTKTLVKLIQHQRDVHHKFCESFRDLRFKLNDKNNDYTSAYHFIFLFCAEHERALLTQPHLDSTRFIELMGMFHPDQFNPDNDIALMAMVEKRKQFSLDMVRTFVPQLEELKDQVDFYAARQDQVLEARSAPTSLEEKLSPALAVYQFAMVKHYLSSLDKNDPFYHYAIKYYQQSMSYLRDYVEKYEGTLKRVLQEQYAVQRLVKLVHRDAWLPNDFRLQALRLNVLLRSMAEEFKQLPTQNLVALVKDSLSAIESRYDFQKGKNAFARIPLLALFNTIFESKLPPEQRKYCLQVLDGLYQKNDRAKNDPKLLENLHADIASLEQFMKSVMAWVDEVRDKENKIPAQEQSSYLKSAAKLLEDCCQHYLDTQNPFETAEKRAQFFDPFNKRIAAVGHAFNKHAKLDHTNGVILVQQVDWMGSLLGDEPKTDFGRDMKAVLRKKRDELTTALDSKGENRAVVVDQINVSRALARMVHYSDTVDDMKSLRGEVTQFELMGDHLITQLVENFEKHITSFSNEKLKAKALEWVQKCKAEMCTAGAKSTPEQLETYRKVRALFSLLNDWQAAINSDVIKSGMLRGEKLQPAFDSYVEQELSQVLYTQGKLCIGDKDQALLILNLAIRLVPQNTALIRSGKLACIDSFESKSDGYPSAPFPSPSIKGASQRFVRGQFMRDDVYRLMMQEAALDESKKAESKGQAPAAPAVEDPLEKKEEKKSFSERYKEGFLRAQSCFDTLSKLHAAIPDEKENKDLHVAVKTYVENQVKELQKLPENIEDYTEAQRQLFSHPLEKKLKLLEQLKKLKEKVDRNEDQIKTHSPDIYIAACAEALELFGQDKPEHELAFIHSLGQTLDRNQWIFLGDRVGELEDPSHANQRWWSAKAKLCAYACAAIAVVVIVLGAGSYYGGADYLKTAGFVSADVSMQMMNYASEALEYVAPVFGGLAVVAALTSSYYKSPTSTLFCPSLQRLQPHSGVVFSKDQLSSINEYKHGRHWYLKLS